MADPLGGAVEKGLKPVGDTVGTVTKPVTGVVGGLTKPVLEPTLGAPKKAQEGGEGKGHESLGGKAQTAQNPLGL